VPQSAWPGIVAALGGVQTYYGNIGVPSNAATIPQYFHIAFNDQNFASINVQSNWTPAQLQNQITLISQIMGANPVAAAQLQNLHNTLAAKVQQ
jgi:hypothetical protein